jgi:hypothetical protein
MVSVSKSAVARPWQRKFLGYSVTWHQEPKLRIAAASLERLTEKVKVLLRGARGRNLVRHDSDPQPTPARLGGVLQADPNQAGAGRAGRMDTASVTLHPVATMETTLRAGAQADATWTDGGAGLALGVQPTRSVVERGRISYARRLPEVLVRSTGAGVAARYGAAPSAHFMNRRMRNRMYGGVGGRPG